MENNIKRPSTSGDNIFQNNNYRHSLQIEKAKAKRRYKDGMNPEKSGIIPPLYNSNRRKDLAKKIRSRSVDDYDSEFSDDSNNTSKTYSGRNADYGKVDFNNPYYLKQKSKESFTNSYLSQFNDLSFDNAGKPVSSNNIHDVIGDNGVIRMENERRLALDGGYSSFDAQDNDMTYGIVSKENFTHTNMQPHFRSSDGGFNPLNEKKYAEQTQRKLDLFTGSANNLDYRPKSERKPLFDPVIGLTSMYGTPVLTDFMDSRYIPSMERRNEKPFQEVRITPGLGLGYNEVSKQGFHDTYRVLPKTVDELRTANKPKISYGTVVIPGQKGERGPIAAKLYKRRPLTYREQSMDDFIGGKSYITKETVYGKWDPKNLATVNRGVEVNGQMGPAYNYTDKHTAESLIPKTQVAKRENFANDFEHNVAPREQAQAREFDESYDPKMTLRAVHNKYDRAGHVGNGEFSKQFLFDYLNAVPEATLRNIHDKYDRAGQVGNAELSKQFLFDYINAIPEATLRNIHDKYDRAGQVGNSELSKHILFDFINAIPDANMRNIHDKSDRAGQMGNAELSKQFLFDYVNAIPDVNMRTIHEKTDRAGQIGNSQYSKEQAFDYVNGIPDATLRNIHDKYDRAGQMGNGEYSKQFAFDYTNAIPDANMRTIHDKKDRAGQLGNGEYSKQFAFDYINAIPDANMRTLHDKTDRAGQMGNAQYSKFKAFDFINATPDANMRTIHDKTDRAGFVSSNERERQRSRGDANNMRVNTAKEKIAEGRAPTLSSYNKGPTIDFTLVQLKEPIQNTRELYPDNQQITTDRLGMLYSKNRPALDQQSYRFFSFVEDNLEGNPYVNNVIHQSQYNFN